MEQGSENDIGMKPNHCDAQNEERSAEDCGFSAKTKASQGMVIVIVYRDALWGEALGIGYCGL